MTDQPIDFRRFLDIVWQYRLVVGVVALVGCLGGVIYTLQNPPLWSSSAVVEVSTSSTGVTATQAVIAGTDQSVLNAALQHAAQGVSLSTLRRRVKVSSLAPGVLSIRAEGTTAAQAEHIANAIGDGYISYLASGGSSLKLRALMVAPATVATGPSWLASLLTSVCIGGVGGVLIGSVGVLVFGRRDRRLGRRAEIAAAIGVPVLASVWAADPRSVGRWRKLLEDYRPSAGDAWRLRRTLQQLRLADIATAHMGRRSSRSLTVISSSADRTALSLGPQLAAYAASLGFPTVLVIGPQQDGGTTASLRTACAALAPASWAKSNLRLAVADSGELPQLPEAVLTVVVAVVDVQAPRLESAIRTDAAVLGVSAGASTADELARIAASAGAAGLEISGILVANPDAQDPTTGRLPHIGLTLQPAMPTRITGTTTEARH
jgi:capsular polysaccharide biosynthesis protein